MNMKYKLLIVAGALSVTGAAVGGALYLAYPVQVTTLAAMAHNCRLLLVCASGHDNDGVECGVQRHWGCCALASRRGGIGGRQCRRLAELQQNAHFGALLAAEPDHYEKSAS